MQDKNNLPGSEWYSKDGTGMTLQEYASKHCISYEAIRRQVAQYRPSLITHILKKGKTQYLDDYAIAFLEKHRRPQSQPEDSNQIRAQIDRLRQDVSESKAASHDFEKISALEQELGALRNEKKRLEDQLKKTDALYQELKHQYDELSQKYINETSELKMQVSCMQPRIDFLENLSKILASQHAPDSKENFDL